MGEILYVFANALSSQRDYKNSNFYISLSKFLNPKFLSYDTLLAENLTILKKDDDDSQESDAEKLTEPSVKGKILNALAYIEWVTLNSDGVQTLFEDAKQSGSVAALVNLALLHLKRGDLAGASQYLKEVSRRKLWVSYPALEKQVQEVLSI